MDQELVKNEHETVCFEQHDNRTQANYLSNKAYASKWMASPLDPTIL